MQMMMPLIERKMMEFKRSLSNREEEQAQGVLRRESGIGEESTQMRMMMTIFSKKHPKMQKTRMISMQSLMTQV